MSKKKDNLLNYEILKEVRKVFRKRMEEKGKPIYANVDYFSGSVYTLMGIRPSLFTPIFAMSRAEGWLAHILEQRSDNRLFRPKALYSGYPHREFVSIEERSR